MKNYIKLALALLTTTGLASGTYKIIQINQELVTISGDNAKIAAESIQNKGKLFELKEENDQRAALIEFTVTAMDMAPKAKISTAERATIADKLARTVMKYLPTQDSREQYISMVKLESNFQNSCKSPVGAIGIGQIMPATFNGTIEKMDIGATPGDIFNEDINLAVGAYYFNELLVEQKGNPRLASIAYNGGSRVAESFKKMGRINQESANYGLHAEHIKETVRDTVRDAAGVTAKK